MLIDERLYVEQPPDPYKAAVLRGRAAIFHEIEMQIFGIGGEGSLRTQIFWCS